MIAARSALLALVLAGFALRTVHLGWDSFWWDEAYSAIVARQSVRAIVETVGREDFHPPLHYLALYAWRVVAGESEYALRFLSVWFGTATIAGATRLAWVWFGRSAALAAGVLVATSPYAAYYAMEARMFALSGFLTVLGLLVVERASARSRSSARWIAFAGIGLANLYTFYYAAFGHLATGLAVLGRSRRAAASFVAASIAVLAALLPWMQTLAQRVGAWHNPWADPADPVQVALWTWSMVWSGVGPPGFLGETVGAVSLASIGVLLALLTLTGGDRSARRARVRAHLIWLVPAALAIGVVLLRPIFHPRYVFPLIPLLLIASAGSLIGHRGAWSAIARASLSLILAVQVLGLYHILTPDSRVPLLRPVSLERDHYREAVAILLRESGPRDVVLTNAPPGVLYYLRGARTAIELPRGTYRPDAILADLRAATAGARRIWRVEHSLRPSDPEGFLRAQFDQGTRTTLRGDLGHLRVWAHEPIGGDFQFAPPIDHPMGPFRVGEDLTMLRWARIGDAVTAGETVHIQITWEVRQRPERDLGMWAQITDTRGTRYGRYDHQPRDDAYRPIREWQPGALVTTGHAIPVDARTPPGVHLLEAAVYELSNLATLPVSDPRGSPIGVSVALGPIVVLPGREFSERRAEDIPLAGGVALRSAGALADTVADGMLLTLDVDWLALTPSPRGVTRLRLVRGDGVAAVEHTYPLGGARPANLWEQGEVVRERLSLRVPVGTPAGEYRVAIAVPSSEAAQPNNEIAIGTVRVSRIDREYGALPVSRHSGARWRDGIDLHGLDVDRTANGVLIRLVWTARDVPASPYKVFVHALDAGGTIIAQHDGVPATWRRPTDSWAAGEFIVDEHPISGVDPAQIRSLRIGLYDAVSGARLRTIDGADSVDVDAGS